MLCIILSYLLTLKFYNCVVLTYVTQITGTSSIESTKLCIFYLMIQEIRTILTATCKTCYFVHWVLNNNYFNNDIFFLYFSFKFSFFSSFTLYPVYNRVDRGSLVLKFSAPHFAPNSAGIACWVTELSVTLYFNTRAKKMKILNITILTSSRNRTHNLLCLQS